MAWLAFVPAHAAPATPSALADALLTATRHGQIDDTWVRAHIEPTDDADVARWADLLAPERPIEATLRGCRGVVTVDAPSAAGTASAVRLDCDPPLVLFAAPADDGWRLRSLGLAGCLECGAHEAFVRGLIAEVGRRGHLGGRLMPGVELITDADGRWDYWSATIAARQHADHTVAREIGGATVVSVEDDVVRLRYPNGLEDLWRIVPGPRGWAVSYDDLPSSSPLHLAALEARRWRRPSWRAETALSTWEPVWQAQGELSLTVGPFIEALAVHPADDTIVAVLVDRAVPMVAVVELDPSIRAVVQRRLLPVPDLDDVAEPTVRVRVRVATDPTTRKVAVAARTRLFVVDLDAGTTTDLGKAREVEALAWGPGGPWWIDGDHRLHAPPDQVASHPPLGQVLALHVDADRIEVLQADGVRLTWRRAAPEIVERAETCGEVGATHAALRPDDDGWLVACAPGAPSPWVTLRDPGGTVEPGPADGAGPLAGSGRRVALVAPQASDGSVLIWDRMTERPEVLLPGPHPSGLVWSADGDALWVIGPDGTAVAWDLAAARRAHAVRTVPGAVESEMPAQPAPRR